jgi:CRISPR/Cas system-associated exonuclease Cas4 (RecB family)
MASFKFCPISFSIKKSFQKLDSILLEKGSFHHDRHLLLQHLKKVYLVRKKKPHTEEQDINMNIRNLVRSFYPNFDFNSSDYHKYAEDIANSELYFYGHDISIERKNYFQNIENNVTMQPDYILKNNKNEFFVIEEKIKFGTKSTDFYANDKVQIASYLTFLKDFNLSYGYLIYWHFENIFSRSPEFCSILRIDKSNELENYVFGLHKYLRDFISKKKLNVENLKYNPKKCAKCSVNLICGHKNRRHNELTIPYDNKFLDLLYVPYPENLK